MGQGEEYSVMMICICIAVVAIVAMLDSDMLTSLAPTPTKPDDYNAEDELLKLMARNDEEIRVKDITAAEEMVRGITFDVFEEDINCKIMQGIKVYNYETVLRNLGKKHHIPDDLMYSLWEGIYAEKNLEKTKNFRFRKGETGQFVFGRIATIQRAGTNTIDLAYSIYTLDFKISPRVIQHTIPTKFLGFTLYTTTTYDTLERDLSSKENKHFEAYFMNKAISGFEAEFNQQIAHEDTNHIPHHTS